MLLGELSMYLQMEGHGTIVTTIFQSRLPDMPTAAISLHETGGMAPEYHADSTEAATERPTVMIVVRDASYGTARSRAEAVLRSLEAVNGTTLSGVQYRRIVPLQSPYDRGPDAQNRAQVAMNILVEKDLSPS